VTDSHEVRRSDDGNRLAVAACTFGLANADVLRRLGGNAAAEVMEWRITDEYAALRGGFGFPRANRVAYNAM